MKNLQMDKILIIDHDTFFADRLSDLLVDGGYKVFTRSTLVESIHVIEDTKLDMVIISLSENIDFEKQIKILKSIDKNMSIIGVITENVCEIISKTLNLGVGDYVMRPILDTGEFFEKIEKNLESKHLKFANESQLNLLKVMNEKLNNNMSDMESDLKVGAEVQRKMLPKNNYNWNGVEFNYLSIPSHFLSGDFLGYEEVNEDECLFYLIDVSGHGPSAAFVALMVYNIIENYKREKKVFTPSDLAFLINDEINKSDINKHLVGVFGIINKKNKTVTYTNAGLYPKPILVDEVKIQYLEKNSMAIGLMPDIKYKNEIIKIEPNQKIILMSDGVFDIIDGLTRVEKEENLLSQIKEGHNIKGVKNNIFLKKDELRDDLSILQINLSLF